jgi:hypothetical protein
MSTETPIANKPERLNFQKKNSSRNFKQKAPRRTIPENKTGREIKALDWTSGALGHWGIGALGHWGIGESRYLDSNQ